MIRRNLILLISLDDIVLDCAKFPIQSCLNLNMVFTSIHETQFPIFNLEKEITYILHELRMIC